MANPYFGTGKGENAEAELESLIAACHSRGMEIIFDFVPNHTSHENQWFKDSAAGKNGKSDWYVWNDKSLDWKNTWGANAWHNKNGKYYYAAFADTQPDLNYRNYEVREEMKNVVRYWLNKGFDGLRIDAVRYLVETEDSLTDTAETHEWFAELREVIDEYESPKFMVCEAWIENDRTALNKYFGTSDKPEFNMVLDFDQGWNCIDDVKDGWNNYVSSRFFTPSDASYSYGTFLGNHDEYHNRLGDYFGNGTSDGGILATALSLLRPTVPFIYYGNEIAQKSGSQSGDFRLRQPFSWSMAEAQKSQPSSILNVNKTLLSLRNSEEYRDLFANGTVKILNCNMTVTDTNTPWKGAIAYTISNADQKLLIVANLTKYNQPSFWFEDFGMSELIGTGYSVLVGNTDTFLILVEDGTDALFTNFRPYEIRVYDLKHSEKSCVLDIWDFPLTTMYLRGTMNSWTSDLMSVDSASGDFYIPIELTANEKYEFKFDENGDWSHSYGSLQSAVLSLNSPIETSDFPGLNTNFSFTPEESGTYTFFFHKNTLTVEIKN